jgi:uncharacterized membrane protein YqiK
MFSDLSQLLLPFIVLFVLLALFIAIALFSRNYLKVAPNTVAVLSGRKRKLPDGRVVGYRMVRGGAALRIPLLEKVDYLSLNVFTISLEIKRAYTMQGVPVSVKAIANVKIRGDESSLHAAAERFLGMTQNQIQQVIFQTLVGPPPLYPTKRPSCKRFSRNCRPSSSPQPAYLEPSLRRSATLTSSS